MASRMTDEEAAATQLDPTPCLCGHPRSEHGDGVVHTACCWIPAANPFGRDHCECDEFEACA